MAAKTSITEEAGASYVTLFKILVLNKVEIKAPNKPENLLCLLERYCWTIIQCWTILLNNSDLLKLRTSSYNWLADNSGKNEYWTSFIFFSRQELGQSIKNVCFMKGI